MTNYMSGWNDLLFKGASFVGSVILLGVFDLLFTAGLGGGASAAAELAGAGTVRESQPAATVATIRQESQTRCMTAS